MKPLLLLLALLALCCSPKQPVFQKQTTVADLRFLTYNIRYDNPADGPDRWELRREALAATVMQQHPSVIGLQEVLAQQLTFLEGKFSGYRRVGVGRDDGLDKGEFSPVFFDSTRFRLINGRTFWLSPTPDVPSKGWDAALPRIATMVVLQEKRSGDTIWVVNSHFDHIGQTARLHSAELIVQMLEPALKSGKRVVFMGDLNAEPSAPPILYLKKHFAEACPETESSFGTFNGFDLQKTQFPRIDYIWHMPQIWKAQQYEVLKPKVNGRQVSDHFAVVARF